MSKKVKALVFLLGVSLLSLNLFADDQFSTTISATVPSMGELDVSISRIDVPGDVWNKNQTSINFGTLSWDSTNHIFVANNYYAVDVGINVNTGSWTLTHNVTSVKHATQNVNLDKNINVTFMNQINDTNATQIKKVVYSDSNGVQIADSQITGWLRIYYGIATGDANKDASGATPIGMDKPAGTYSGTVTLSLTVQ
jgi:hypothetical protein